MLVRGGFTALRQTPMEREQADKTDVSSILVGCHSTIMEAVIMVAG